MNLHLALVRFLIEASEGSQRQLLLRLIFTTAFCRHVCCTGNRMIPYWQFLLLSEEQFLNQLHHHHIGIVAVLSRYCRGIVAVLSRYCRGIVAVLSRYCRGIVAVLSRYCRGIVAEQNYLSRSLSCQNDQMNQDVIEQVRTANNWVSTIFQIHVE